MRKKLPTLLVSALLVSALALLNLGAPAWASSGDWADAGHARLRLISQTDAVGDGAAVTLGLHFELEEHWKIYWRSPGDAGFPPSLALEGSTNAKAAGIRWPLPERFSILSFETLGYSGEVVLPVTLALERPGEAVSIQAQVSYLACADICIPHDEVLSLSLPAGPAQPSPEAHLISRFAAQVPGDGRAVGLALGRIQAKADGPDADTGVLYVTATAQNGFTAPDLYIEGPETLAFAKPKRAVSADGKLTLLEVPFQGLKSLKTPLFESLLTLTLADAPSGAEFTARPEPATADVLALADDLPREGAPAGPPLLAMLGLALLGGVILNLMPCVLPVLSIKLLSVVGHGGGETRVVRASFLASAAGIVTSFLALALALLALKGAGLAIGWGIQFQHPWFLVAMTLVVTLFACNLWGVFEVHLPEQLAELGAHETHVHGLGGHFLTGALATLLATPCSAPFLGTAVGFALARGSSEILAIFAALGVGLALPYLVVAAAPGLATKMPRPGRWMVALRRVLGFALAGTGVWLLTILGVQVSDIAAMLIGALMIAVAAMLYIHKRLGRRYGRLDWMAVAVLAALAFAVPDTVGRGSGEREAAQLEGLWQPFDERAIAQLVADGKVVFVDVTADWCITCQVNKAAVVSRGEVLKRLSAPGVIAMKADWTRPDEAIGRYLASFGRYGIPFNVVYGPGAPDGIALPELLTQKAVLDALDQAARAAP